MKLRGGGSLYCILAALAFVIYLLFEAFLGIYCIGVAILGMRLCRNAVVMLLCFFSVSCGIAFDYYLRVSPGGFLFYYGDGESEIYLCLIFVLLLLSIFYVDSLRQTDREKGVLLSARMPEVSSLMFWPCFAAVAWCTAFVLMNAGNVFSSSFDLHELNKYSFLEYFGVVALFLLMSARGECFKVRLSLVLVGVFICVLLLASYRMVAITLILTVFFYFGNGRYTPRRYLVSLWVVGYLVFGVVNVLRSGSEDFSMLNILGYKYAGVLDNTFTGVIETALIYTGISTDKGLYVIFLELLGTVLPLPSSVLPESMVYYSGLEYLYFGRIPGGGVIAGFILYFDYFLLPPVLLYLYFALVRSDKNIFFGILAFVCFVSVSRWWLYGPYVLFKFLGFFMVFYFVNSLLLSLERRHRVG